jgi:hypothetical protein
LHLLINIASISAYPIARDVEIYITRGCSGSQEAIPLSHTSRESAVLLCCMPLFGIVHAEAAVDKMIPN